MAAADVTIWLALGAGIISFLSPCTLPIFPAYLSYITGVSVKDLKESHDAKIRGKLLVQSAFFLLGVSLVFISLGVGFSFIGGWIQDFLSGGSGKLLQRLAGIFIIFMGFVVAGWLNVKTFMKEKRFQFAKKPVGYLGTIFVGIGFGAGWTPCIGPIFAAILAIAASNPGQGTLYTFMYVIGFALPFLVLTFFIGSTKWLTKYSNKIMKVGGSVMIVMGLLLFTGQMSVLSEYLESVISDTWLNKLG